MWGWGVYLTSFGEHEGAVVVNLDADAQPAKPWLLTVEHPIRFPSSRGYPQEKEQAAIGSIDDALTEFVAASLDGEHVGRYTSNGRRLFYFYLPKKGDYASAIEQVIHPFKHYKPIVRLKRDAGWRSYHKDLYPSPQELQGIQNRKLIDVFAQSGDDLSQPRIVEHWIYAPEREAAEKIKLSAQKLGFEVRPLRKLRNTTNPYGLCLSRSHSLELQAVDETCIALQRLAKRHHSDYDGWEAPVVSIARPRKTRGKAH